MDEIISIRKMEPSQAKEFQRLGRVCFAGAESFFVPRPKEAIVAMAGDKMVAGLCVERYSLPNGNVGYMDNGFVAKAYRGKGLGGRLYAEGIAMLEEGGADYITACVKNDNISSYSLVEKNGLRRVSSVEACKVLGVKGFLLHMTKVPFGFFSGHDFYLRGRESVRAKEGCIGQLLLFFLLNLACLTLGLFSFGVEAVLPLFAAAFTTLAVSVLSSLAGSLFAGGKWTFRTSEGGLLLTLLIGFGGGFFPMQGKWFPVGETEAKTYRLKLFLSAVAEWIGILCFAVVITLKARTGVTQFMSISADYILCLMAYRLIPFYPFNTFGGERVYSYSVFAFDMLAICTAVVTSFMMVALGAF